MYKNMLGVDNEYNNDNLQMENKRDGVTVSKWRGVCSKISFGAGLAAALFFLLFGVSWLLLDKDSHLIGRLDEWMLHLGFFSVLLTLIFKPGNSDGRWWRRTLFIVGKTVAILLILFCWILVFMCTSVGDRWSTGEQLNVNEWLELRENGKD